MVQAIAQTMPSFGLGFHQNSGEPPRKYIRVDGVTQLNPEYVKWQENQGKAATTALEPDKALPVVTDMQDVAELNEASQAAGEGGVPLSAATDATIQMMQENDICQQVGLSSDAMVDGLGEIFRKHEAPIGLMNKLMVLTEYDELEFMFDDSGSMGMTSDTKDKFGRFMTRWEEAKSRMHELIEIMAYVPTPKITFCFLNRRIRESFTRNGETPERFKEIMTQKLENCFRNMPSGSTPMRERLEESLQRGQGRRVSRYIFADGQPNGRQYDIDLITKMCVNRKNAEGNPITFMSCSEIDDDVEWMKEAEEIAPYAAEYDDFKAEAMEVMRDQGPVLPFTKGFYLVGCLVGAMNPDDLDAMDESVPFTKWQLDNLLGVQSTDKDFRRYWDGMINAQRTRVIETKMDRVKANFQWDRLYNKFLTVRMAKNIPEVQDFKRQLENCN